MWTMECICQKVRVVFVSRIESIPFKVLGKSKKLQNEASSNSKMQKVRITNSHKY